MAWRHVRTPLAVLTLAVAACGGSSTAPTPVPEGPVVQSITPNSGSIAGGTEVTIRGLRFAAGASVAIGGQPAVDVAVQGTDTIIAKTPAGPAGVAAVVVTVAGRSGSLPAGFTYLTPPSNNLPVILAISAQGTRPREPADFADLRESIAVSASVQDDETSADRLEYQWSASAGAFEGSGARVTWRAPDTAPTTPAEVIITLRVVERYGAGGFFQHQVTGTRAVSLHDSVREVSVMSERFLTEFSKPQTNKDWRDVMRDFDFTGTVCPDRSLAEAERNDVITHYTNFVMLDYKISAGVVTLEFGGTCAIPNRNPRRGDACAVVPVFWHSTDRRDPNNQSRQVTGTDYISAAYSRAQSRWWLCSSDFKAADSLSLSFYSR
jgi:hypothetical protein